jgi:hypothetical protein
MLHVRQEGLEHEGWRNFQAHLIQAEQCRARESEQEFRRAQREARGIEEKRTGEIGTNQSCGGRRRSMRITGSLVLLLLQLMFAHHAFQSTLHKQF